MFFLHKLINKLLCSSLKITIESDKTMYHHKKLYDFIHLINLSLFSVNKFGSQNKNGTPSHRKNTRKSKWNSLRFWILFLCHNFIESIRVCAHNFVSRVLYFIRTWLSIIYSKIFSLPLDVISAYFFMWKTNDKYVP